MNIEKCRKLLNIDDDQELTPELIRKCYRINALKYHPDKNSEPDARDKFEEIKKAYEYLNKQIEWGELDDDNFVDNDERDDYHSLLFAFVNNVVQKSCDVLQSKLFNIIIGKISTLCEEKTIQLLQKIDKNILIKIYEILSLYRDSFHLSDVLFYHIEEILQQKKCNDECIILNPLIDDLLERNVYKMTIDSNIYLIPLWHHELIYDNSGSDLYVRCNPILPDNMSIDENNNINVKVKYNISEIFGKEFVEISVGKRIINIQVKSLCIVKTQTFLEINNNGIPRINTEDIYNVDNSGEIIIEIELDV